MGETKKNAVERLEELLNEKDAELEELRAKLEAIEDHEAYGWTRHRMVPEGDDVPKLPVPRLQIRLVPLGDEGHEWYSYVAMYELVYRHYLGRSEIGRVPSGDPDLIAIPLGTTRVNGGGGLGRNKPPIYNGKIDLPLRDGTHILSDADHLKLPMFVICGDLAQPIEPRELPALKKGK